MNTSFDYSRWSDAELARQRPLQQILTENEPQISCVLTRQRRVLDYLIGMLQRHDLSLKSASIASHALPKPPKRCANAPTDSSVGCAAAGRTHRRNRLTVLTSSRQESQAKTQCHTRCAALRARVFDRPQSGIACDPRRHP